MASYVLVADCLEKRAGARAHQLAVDGWSVQCVTNVEEARRLLPEAQALVVGEFAGRPGQALQLVRDIRGGEVDGTARDLRILSTARGEAEAISALRSGADMILAPGASVMLVSESISTVMRRADDAPASASMRVGALEVNRTREEVTFAGRSVRLSRREMELLTLLASKPGRVFTRDEISREVWGTPNLRGSRAIDTHLSRIAGKFRAHGGHDVVRNVWGRGYKLNHDPQQEGVSR